MVKAGALQVGFAPGAELGLATRRVTNTVLDELRIKCAPATSVSDEIQAHWEGLAIRLEVSNVFPDHL